MKTELNLPSRDTKQEDLDDIIKNNIKKSEDDGRKAIIVVYVLLIILSAMLSVAGVFYEVIL